MRRLPASAAALLLLAGCSPHKDIEVAESGITAFQQKLNAQEFDAIYAAVASELKGATTRAAHNRLLVAIHRKLGNFQSGSSLAWNDNVSIGSQLLTINLPANMTAARRMRASSTASPGTRRCWPTSTSIRTP